MVYLKRIETNRRLRNCAARDKLLLGHIALVCDSVALVTLFLYEVVLIAIHLLGEPQRWRLLMKALRSLIERSKLPLAVSDLLRANIYAVLVFLLVSIVIDCDVLVYDLSASGLHLRVVPTKHIGLSPSIPLSQFVILACFGCREHILLLDVRGRSSLLLFHDCLIDVDITLFRVEILLAHMNIILADHS